MARMARLRTRAAGADAGPNCRPFAREGDRARLSEVAIKAFLALVKAWGLSNAEAAGLLGVSASSLDRIKRGYRPTLSQDQLTRVSALVGVFQGPASSVRRQHGRRLGPQAESRRRCSTGRTPIEAMIEGGIPRMLDVRRYVDAVRGGL